MIDQGLYSAYEIAVDPSGNVYIDSQNNDELYKETPASGTYTQSLVSSTLGYVNGLAVDGTGNIYVAGTPGTPTLTSLRCRRYRARRTRRSRHL